MSLPRLPLILIVLPLLVLAFVSDAKAQVVEAVKEYTITVEQGGGSCETVQTPGDLCGDGMDIVFMGDGVTGRRLFAAPAPLSQMTWNDGSTSWLTRLNRYDPVNGAVNTSGIAAADANRNLVGTQVHLAATACHNLSHGGYDDWYLPALQEAHSLYLNRSAFPTNPGTIWTSTERDEVHAYSYNLGTGAVTATEDKWTSRNVQCVVCAASVPLIYVVCAG